MHICAQLQSPVVVSDIRTSPPSSSGARLLAITCIKLFVAVVLSRYCITLGRGRVGAGGSLAHFLLVGGLAILCSGWGRESHLACVFLIWIACFHCWLSPVSAVSPLNVDQFCQELNHRPNPQLVSFVLDGIRHGFKLGFSHRQLLRSARRSKPSAYAHPTVIDGPFASPLSFSPC